MFPTDSFQPHDVGLGAVISWKCYGLLFFWKVMLRSVMVMHWCSRLTWSSIITYTDGGRRFLWNVITYLRESSTQISDQFSWYWVFRCFPHYLQANTDILLQITTLSLPSISFSVRLRLSYHSTLSFMVCATNCVAGDWLGHSPLSYSEVQEIIQTYLYSPSWPFWPILGWKFPFT